MVKQTDQYEWVTAYLKGRGLQTTWQRATFAFTASQAALPLLMLWSPTGPTNEISRAVSVAIALLGFAGATLWLVHWPTRRQSILFSLGASAAIAAVCLGLSNPYTGLMGCTMFAMLGGFIAYFHAGCIPYEAISGPPTATRSRACAIGARFTTRCMSC